MPTLTINPIPYNGGTIDLRSGRDHTIVHMGGGKFVMFYGQSNPSMIFAHTVNLTDAKSASPKTTFGPQIAFTSGGSRVRAWKLATNRILALFGNDLRVIDIDGDDGLTLRNAQLVNFHVSALWNGVAGDELANDYTGNSISASMSVENTVIFARRQASTSTNFFTGRIVYDPVADSLTSTIVDALDLYSSSKSHVLRVDNIPNTNGKIIYALTGPGPSNAQRATYTQRCETPIQTNELGNIVRAYGTTNSNQSYGYSMNDGMYPLQFVLARANGDELIGFQNARTAQFHTGSPLRSPTHWSGIRYQANGQWSTNRIIVSGASSDDNYFICGGTMIDENHAAIVSTGQTLLPSALNSAREVYNSPTRAQKLRIIKIFNRQYGEASDQTKVIETIPLGIPLNPDMGAMLYKIEEGVFAYISKADSTAGSMQLSIKTIY